MLKDRNVEIKIQWAFRGKPGTVLPWGTGGQVIWIYLFLFSKNIQHNKNVVNYTIPPFQAAVGIYHQMKRWYAMLHLLRRRYCSTPTVISNDDKSRRLVHLRKSLFFEIYIFFVQIYYLKSFWCSNNQGKCIFSSQHILKKNIFLSYDNRMEKKVIQIQ
jgi:hypothetical protein